jgi:hypothetical protein
MNKSDLLTCELSNWDRFLEWLSSLSSKKRKEKQRDEQKTKFL